MSDQTTPRPRRQLPKVKFRVLIAGRANAGKTTILQRVCDTTESPETYRLVDGERTKIQLIPTSDRGEHDITDQLEFSNHNGYVFHDSCGLENGSTKELKSLQDFVRKHAEKKTLREQLHVIWYCIPMDDHRPGLNVDPLHALQIDNNVPVIAVFTKLDAFRRNIRMDLEDDEQMGDDLDRLTNQRCEEIFERECLDKIGDTTPFVLLEGMNDPAAHCDELIQTTAEALNSGTVTLMLLAVQTKNLELSVQRAVQKSLEVFNVEPRVLMKGGFMKKIKKSVTKALARAPSKSLKVEDVVKECLRAFPWLWWRFIAPPLTMHRVHDQYYAYVTPDTYLDDAYDTHTVLAYTPDTDAYTPDTHTRPLRDSLLRFAENLQNHAGQDHNSQCFLIIALIAVVRYATITFINMQISADDALNEAYRQAPNVLPKLSEWIASSTAQSDDIVAFINSMPWDMNILHGLSS